LANFFFFLIKSIQTLKLKKLSILLDKK